MGCPIYILKVRHSQDLLIEYCKGKIFFPECPTPISNFGSLFYVCYQISNVWLASDFGIGVGIHGLGIPLLYNLLPFYVFYLI